MPASRMASNGERMGVLRTGGVLRSTRAPPDHVRAPYCACKKREACPHVSVSRLLIATASARRYSGSRPEHRRYRTMTYSKGAPGEVRLEGTVSDPAACPSPS